MLMQGIQQGIHANVLPAEDRVLWYSAQYRDWDVTNGSIAQEASHTPILQCSPHMMPCASIDGWEHLSFSALGEQQLWQRRQCVCAQAASGLLTAWWPLCRMTFSCLAGEAGGRAGRSMYRMSGAWLQSSSRTMLARYSFCQPRHLPMHGPGADFTVAAA